MVSKVCHVAAAFPRITEVRESTGNSRPMDLGIETQGQFREARKRQSVNSSRQQVSEQLEQLKRGAQC
jgi:hypothetical protein